MRFFNAKKVNLDEISFKFNKVGRIFNFLKKVVQLFYFSVA